MGAAECGSLRWGYAPIVTANGGDDGATPNTSQKVRSRRDSSRTRAPSGPHPACCLLTTWDRSLLIGTSVRAMECAGGFGAMAYVPGVVAVTIAATAGLSFDCRGLSS